MHIKNMHMKKPTRASKRLPPVLKASKRNKHEPIISPNNDKMNIPNFDDLILLSSDEPPIFDATNLEEQKITYSLISMKTMHINK